MVDYNPYFSSGLGSSTLQKPAKHLDHVHGIEGAKAYARSLGVNEDTFVLDDTESNIGYFLMTDSTGFPTVKTVKTQILQDRSTSTLEETLQSINQRLDRLEKRSEQNGKQGKYQ